MRLVTGYYSVLEYTVVPCISCKPFLPVQNPFVLETPFFSFQTTGLASGIPTYTGSHLGGRFRPVPTSFPLRVGRKRADFPLTRVGGAGARRRPGLLEGEGGPVPYRSISS